MAQPTIQTSFASGEWAPKLRSRVDIQKYRAGAALLRNFYVDYSGGGASTRPGTRFINQAFNSSRPVRLIPFQPSANLSYVLEFGDGYIRFFSNGAPIVEPPTAITGVTNANPGVVTDTGHGYSNGQWIFLTGIGGTVQLNNNYYIVQGATTNTFTLTDLNGNAINTTSFGVYTTGGTAQRVYTIMSPYAATDLFPNPITGNQGIKFVQNVTSLIITHQSYPVQILTINSAANWTLTTANFGATIAQPTISSLVSSVASSSNWSYAYTVTAVDVNGQESTAPTPATLINYPIQTSPTSPLTFTLTWGGVPGAVSYNVYKASPIFAASFPATIPVGFIANVTGTVFDDATPGIAPDFSQTPPIGQNPFQGAGVLSYTVTASGAPQSSVPTVIVGAPPAGGFQATASASLGVATYTGSGSGQMSNSQLGDPTGSFIIYPNGVTAKITSAAFVGFFSGFPSYNVNSDVLANPGSITGAGSSAPGSITGTSCTAQYFNHWVNPPTRTVTWGVTTVGAIV